MLAAIAEQVASNGGNWMFQKAATRGRIWRFWLGFKKEISSMLSSSNKRLTKRHPITEIPCSYLTFLMSYNMKMSQQNSRKNMGRKKYVASTWKITTEPDQHDCCACMQSAQSSGSTVSLVQKAWGFQSSSWVFRDSWIMSMKREDHCTHDTFWHMATNRIMGKKGLT